MSADQYVATGEIRVAAEGNEESVLQSLGIQPNQRRNAHIDCPYPEHGGKGDWRWDHVKGRARCTCTKGDSIFDVVMKCRGVDFEEAKIVVAEAIGRQDLVKTKGDGKDAERDPDNRFLKSTAAGLCAVKARFRDDALVAIYLGSRLGIADCDVLLPSTPIRGITHHHHYKGKGRDGKPKSVAVTPCAVFVQTDRDRRTHAHRIFLTPDGKGKASLPDGMDPKKSAKKENEEDNVSGRCVVWGDPTKAPHLVACEGIETAQAVAQTFRAEVEAREMVVVSAIAAVGIEALRPWPATKRVTIAADRDDAEKRGRPGSQRGDKAARVFGVRQMETKVAVAIALPGEAGQSLDWLDVYTSGEGGPEAVRSGILGAEPFQATKEEIAEHRKNVDREAELAEIAQTYPLPTLQTKALVYAHDAADRIKVHKVVEERKPGQPPKQFLVPIMTPFGIAARLRNVNEDDSYSLRLVVQDMNGRPRNIDVARRDLAKMNGVEIRSLLLEGGLRVEDDGEAVAVAMLKGADPEFEIAIVRHPGWHQMSDGGDPFFVTPGGLVIGAPKGDAVELYAGARLPAVSVHGGTLEGWKAAAAMALAQVDCPHWALGIMAGFAGPIIALTGLDTCGINLSGRSSSGKTTAQKLAVSAWTVPDTTKPGLARSARATANAIESLSQQANATILSLDELAHVNGKETGKMIYTIAGGVGKARMRQDASLREASRWSTFAILSAESSLQEKVEADGETFMAGMAARIPDVDVSGIDRNVDKAAMRQIEEVTRNFGHAGPAFVEAIQKEGLHLKAAQLRESILQRALVLAGGEGADSALIRAAQPFAILAAAGTLAQAAGLLPKTVDLMRAIGWAWGRFNLSADAGVLNPHEQALASLRLWINERWGVSIRGIDAQAGNQIALAWYDEDAVYIPRERLREASGGALKEQELAAALDEAGHLYKRDDAKRPYVRYVPKLGKVQAYALRRPTYGRSGFVADQDQFRVYDGGRA